MYRLKNILRLISVLAIVLIVGTAPYLQAYQSNYLDDDCSKSRCCGCSHEQGEVPLNEAVSVESSCCCSVSAPVTETEAPLEPQLLPTTSPDTFATETSATSHITVVETEPYQAAQINEPSAHGPPLYVLNASYLI